MSDVPIPWREVSKQAREAQPWCSYCGTSEDLTADHRIPRALGGQDTRDNCIVLCRSCNSKKGKRYPYRLGGISKDQGRFEL